MASDPLWRSQKVTFYKSGDPKVNGVTLHIGKHNYRGVDALLDELSQKLPGLSYGVRKIYTPGGRTQIKSIDELQNHGNYYVCTDNPSAEKVPGVDMSKVNYYHDRRHHRMEFGKMKWTDPKRLDSSSLSTSMNSTSSLPHPESKKVPALPLRQSKSLDQFQVRPQASTHKLPLLQTARQANKQTAINGVTRLPDSRLNKNHGNVDRLETRPNAIPVQNGSLNQRNRQHLDRLPINTERKAVQQQAAVRTGTHHRQIVERELKSRSQNEPMGKQDHVQQPPIGTSYHAEAKRLAIQHEQQSYVRKEVVEAAQASVVAAVAQEKAEGISEYVDHSKTTGDQDAHEYHSALGETNNSENGENAYRTHNNSAIHRTVQSGNVDHVHFREKYEEPTAPGYTFQNLSGQEPFKESHALEMAMVGNEHIIETATVNKHTKYDPVITQSNAETDGTIAAPREAQSALSQGSDGESQVITVKGNLTGTNIIIQPHPKVSMKLKIVNTM